MHSRRASTILLAAAALTAASTAFVAGRQVEVSGGGRALDANLRLGSGGYNRGPSGGTMVSRRYTPGQTRQLYTVSRTGEMVYSPNNAFNPRGQYRATGYTGDTFSNQYHRRFRYFGNQ